MNKKCHVKINLLYKQANQKETSKMVIINKKSPKLLFLVIFSSQEHPLFQLEDLECFLIMIGPILVKVYSQRRVVIVIKGLYFKTKVLLLLLQLTSSISPIILLLSENKMMKEEINREMEIVLSFKDSNLQKSIHQKVQANMNTPINVRYALKIKPTKLKRTMGK